jgi:hypothetical protein
LCADTTVQQQQESKPKNRIIINKSYIELGKDRKDGGAWAGEGEGICNALKNTGVNNAGSFAVTSGNLHCLLPLLFKKLAKPVELCLN